MIRPIHRHVYRSYLLLCVSLATFIAGEASYEVAVAERQIEPCTPECDRNFRAFVL